MSRLSRSDKSAALIGKVVDSIRELDITDTGSWSDLDALSTHTVFEGVDVDPEGITLLSDDRFSGIMNVYLLLQYGAGDEGFSDSEGFLGQFEGHFDEHGKPILDDIKVDTSPFYGEESVQQ